MAGVGILRNVLQKLVLTDLGTSSAKVTLTTLRFKSRYVELPDIGRGKSFRRIVHFPESGVYTVEPLDTTHLAGRDPVSGRVVCKGIGGGVKHKYHWIDWFRVGPKDGPPIEERVIQILTDGCRTSHIALVAIGKKMKYILATKNMKAGDILRTSSYIPRNPVRAYEGDAYPLGALPLGTEVCCVEHYPGKGGFLCHAAGAYATILRKAPNNHVIIKMPSKREFSVHETGMCTVGRIGNEIHSSIPIGSPQNLRALGYRPRSGLWQRKTGWHGRKINPTPPMRTYMKVDLKKEEMVSLSLEYEDLVFTPDHL